ncbi:hypothetical protein [Streptococcus suis]|uniref:hypothetical protein n=1 Tax=Streptococcus suis TaxID=1307 RepID=UPI00137B7591|nr:hypothetical protein [Streptococcus suis]
MTTLQEQRIRQILVKDTMKRMGLSKKKAQKVIAELEMYGLLKFTPDGKLAFRELGA